MKVNARNAEGFARNPSPGVHAVLIYGPDFGLVQERAVTILASTGVELNDPFSAVTLRGDAIAREPARLLDEATSISFQGGTRIVRVQGATDTICDSVAPLFERSIENVLIVLEAGELGPRSRLRRLFEATEYGAALACYLDDDFERERVLEGYIRDEGKSVEKSALSYLASHLSGDRALARRELERYLGLPNYRQCWHNLGFSEADLDNGGSNRFIDAMVVWGNEDKIQQRLDEHFDAGATHVCIQPVHTPDDLDAAEKTLEALAPG